MKRRMDRLIHALVLVRIGQELGTATPAARVIHDAVELLAAIPFSFLL